MNSFPRETMRGKGGLKLELSKLKASLDELLKEKKEIRVKMKLNRINIQDILTEHKMIEKELEETETKISMISQEMSEIVDEDEENNDCDDGKGFVFEEERLGSRQERLVAPDTTINGLNITAVAFPDIQEVIDVSPPPLTKNTQGSESVAKKAIGKVQQVMIRNVNEEENLEDLPSEQIKEKNMPSDLKGRNGRAVVLNKPKSEVVNRTYLKRKSTLQLTGRTPGPARKQVVVQRPPVTVESMLNESVIDCEYVLKKSILKEKQVIKLKTEAPPPNLFACNYCSKSFTCAAPLAAHIASHNVGAVLDCPFPMCAWHSPDQLKLTQHMRSKHTKEQLFNCYSCEAKFSTLVAKTAHERRHTDQGLEQCGRCLKFYQMSKNCRCSTKPH